jgi:hypothetical protein
LISSDDGKRHHVGSEAQTRTATHVWGGGNAGNRPTAPLFAHQRGPKTHPEALKPKGDEASLTLDRRAEGSSHSLQRSKPGSDQDTLGGSTTNGSHCEDLVHHSDGTDGRTGRSRQGSGVLGLRRFQLCHGHRTIRRWRPRSSLISGSDAADRPEASRQIDPAIVVVCVSRNTRPRTRSSDQRQVLTSPAVVQGLPRAAQAGMSAPIGRFSSSPALLSNTSLSRNGSGITNTERIFSISGRCRRRQRTLSYSTENLRSMHLAARTPASKSPCLARAKATAQRVTTILPNWPLSSR